MMTYETAKRIRITKDVLPFILLGYGLLIPNWELTRLTFAWDLPHFRFFACALILPCAIITERLGKTWTLTLAGSVVSAISSFLIIESFAKIVAADWRIILQMLIPEKADGLPSAIPYLLFILLGFATALSVLPESIKGIMHWHDYPKLRKHRMFT